MGDLQDLAITDRIAEHLRRGELLDLAPDLALGSLVDAAVMKSWDGSHSIAADDIRDLLRGRVVTDPDPRGLRLRAAPHQRSTRPGQSGDDRQADSARLPA